MHWRAGIWFENRLQMNDYDIKLSLLTATLNQEDHIVCIARLKHLIYVELDSTVFINQNDIKAMEDLSAAGIKITTLPEDPIDQIIGLMLFNKINAIMEGRMLLKEIDINSDLGDTIHYLHNDLECSAAEFGTGWWDDPSPCHSNFKSKNNKKVVKLTRNLSWQDLELCWDGEAQDDVQANTVVKFNRDED
jgi:hypothetical protein